MTRSSRDPRSSKTGNREILDDWDPSTSGDDVDAEPHQARSGLHSAAQSSSTSAADSASTGPPHFAWADLDRADPAAPRPLSSPSRDGPQPRAAGWLRARGVEAALGARPHEFLLRRQRRTTAGTCLNQVRCSRAFASSLSWAEARSRGSILAEDVSLGRRPVAIKVSRPDGNEPQILARLQHTHIVPVHSVCDDPETGLRSAVHALFRRGEPRPGARGVRRSHPDAPHGRSLVKALDQVSRGSTSRSSGCSLHRHPAVANGPGDQTRPHRPALPVDPSSPATRARLPRGSDRCSRDGSAQCAVTTARLEELEADHGQPSRLFLHGASAIEAAVWIVARLADGLEHAHSRGLLHRDLKPANVLMAGDGTPMLLDFNLSVEAVASPRRDRGPPRVRRRHAPLHVARASRRVQSPRINFSRGRRRALRHLRSGADPV